MRNLCSRIGIKLELLWLRTPHENSEKKKKSFHDQVALIVAASFPIFQIS